MIKKRRKLKIKKYLTGSAGITDNLSTDISDIKLNYPITPNYGGNLTYMLKVLAQYENAFGGNLAKGVGTLGGVANIASSLNGDGDNFLKAAGITQGGLQVASNLGLSAAGKAVPYVQAVKGLYDFGANAVNSAETGVVDPFGGALNGAATGAAVGSIIPGIGTAAGAIGGAVVGAVTSSIGTPGTVDYYGNIRDANGLNGLLDTGHSKGYLQMLARRAKTNLAHIAAEERLIERDTDPGVTLAAVGGVIPNTLAYLDDGELIKTPDGLIMEIPEEGKPTDSNLVDVPEGTKVLSDKNKVPGTNKTYAQVGKEIMKPKKYNKDKFALNSKYLNDLNNLAAFDALLAKQESMKRVHRELKKGLPMALTGSNGLSNTTSNFTYSLLMKSTAYSLALRRINLDNYVSINDMLNTYPTLNLTSNPSAKLNYDQAVKNYQSKFNQNPSGVLNPVIAANVKGIGDSGDNASHDYTDGYGGAMTVLRHLGTNAVSDAEIVSMNAILNENGLEAYRNPSSGMINYRPLKQTRGATYGTVPIQGATLIVRPTPLSVPDGMPKAADGVKGRPIKGKTAGNAKNGIPFNLQDAMQLAALIKPKAKPEPVSVYTYEPTYGPTTYNINPLLREINTSNALVRYNAATLSPTTGAGMARGIAASMLRNRAIAEAYRTKYNTENQLAFNNAEIANTRNRYDAEARHTQAVEYAQNKAAADMTNQQYLADAFKYMQTKQQEYNQASRDEMVLPFLQEYLKGGYSQLVINRAFNK